MRSRWLLAGALLAAFLEACQSTEIGPLGAGETRAPDELALWDESKEWDERVSKSEARVDEPALQAYLEGVAGKVYAGMPGRTADEIRIHVMRTPFLNASASPTGTVILHSGLLARLEDEAELATLLGHELAHFVSRHSLREKRMRENALAKRRLAGGLLSIALMNPIFMEIVGSEQSESLERQLRGYSRELEREADLAGFEAMRAAGYDVRRSVRLFEAVLIDDDGAKVPDPYYWADHPSMEERAAHYRELISAASSSGGEVGSERYAAHVEKLIEANVRDDLGLARVRSSKAGVERLLARPEPSAEAYFLLGDWHRLAGDASSPALAAEAYAKAARLDPKHAAAARANGLALRGLGQNAAAAAELSRAIALDPEAADRPILEAFVRELEAPAP